MTTTDRGLQLMGDPGNGPVEYHDGHLSAPCCREIERLRQVYEHDMTLAAAEGQADYEECRRLKAEVERLKSAVTDLGVLHITAHAEVERLKAENRGLVETIGEWQEIHGTFVAK